MKTTPNITKIVLGVLLLALISFGLYLDLKPAQDDVVEMDQDTTMPMEHKDDMGATKENTGTVPKSNTTTTTSKDGKTITKTVVVTTPAANPFPNTQWVWKYTTYADKSKTITPNNERFVLKFATNGQMSSATDCNSVSGKYTPKINQGITFGPLMSTLMACTEETLESEYVTELSSVVLYTLPTKAELNLHLANNAGTMVFIKKTN
jgi:heat shock protein HslJ